MSPGPVDEAGKVASTFIDSLKGSPVILAFTMFNILFLAFVTYSTVEERGWREKVVSMMVDQQSKATTLLSACVPLKDLPGFIKQLRSPDDDDK